MKSATYRFYQFMIALAITIFEGWFPGSRSWTNKNPGNLRNWDPRLPKDDQGFDIFPSVGAGFRALLRQVELNIDRRLTLLEFFAGSPGVYSGYAPAADGNDPAGYARFVSKKTGIPVANIPILQFIVSIQQRFT